MQCFYYAPVCVRARKSVTHTRAHTHRHLVGVTRSSFWVEQRRRVLRTHRLGEWLTEHGCVRLQMQVEECERRAGGNGARAAVRS